MRSNTRHTVVTTPIGEVTLVASGDMLTGLYFARQWRLPAASTFGSRVPAGSDELLNLAKRQLDDYLAGGRTAFALPTRTEGDAFQERVWALLREIPYGATTTYGDLAEACGDRRLARDVGQAVGRNPLGVIVPCHRVVGKDGALVGYAGGLERKRALLELEGALPPVVEVRNLTLWST